MELNKQKKVKELFLFLVFIFLASVPIFAQEGQTGINALDSATTKILDILNSGIIKTICLVVFAITGVSIVVKSKQGADMRELLSSYKGLFIGGIALMCANDIIAWIFNGFELTVPAK